VPETGLTLKTSPTSKPIKIPLTLAYCCLKPWSILFV
jgi:hypothetical protein